MPFDGVHSPTQSSVDLPDELDQVAQQIHGDRS